MLRRPIAARLRAIARMGAVVSLASLLGLLASCGEAPTVPRAPNGAAIRNSDEPYCGFNSYGDCTLSPVGTGVYSGCTSPVTSVDYCQGGGSGGTGLVGEGGGSGGGEPSGGWGDGTSPGITTNADTASDRPCHTSDPVIDDPRIQAALQSIWQQSNPTSAIQDRLEQGGWIVQVPGGGYDFVPFGPEFTREACSISPPDPLPPAPPGAVSFVHTHPWQKDELLTSCDPVVIGGQAFYPTYKNSSDGDDQTVAGAWGFAFAYLIDKNGISKFTPASITDQRYGRCAY